MIHLSNDRYTLSARITEEYYYQIRAGTKQIEYRPPTKYWNVRCKNAMVLMEKGYSVRIVLICGGRTMYVKVLGIGKITTSLEQWTHLKGVSPKFSDRPWCWGIILGDML